MFRELFGKEEHSPEEDENSLVGKKVTLSSLIANAASVSDIREFTIAEVRDDGKVRLEEIAGWFNPDTVEEVEK